MLITPETSEERVREIDAHTDGFIYMVSYPGGCYVIVQKVPLGTFRCVMLELRHFE